MTPELENELARLHRYDTLLSDDQWEAYAFLLSEHGNPLHATAPVKAETSLKTVRRWEG